MSITHPFANVSPRELQTPNKKRHTRPCIYFQSDTCPLSPEECDFAHVIVPEQALHSLQSPQATLRTKTCRFYSGGSCRQGIWCRFKHPAKVADAVPNSPTTSHEEDGTMDCATDNDDSIDVRDLLPEFKPSYEHHPKYRTRPCRNYLMGKCVFGDACNYVHSSPGALRSLPSSTLVSPISPQWPATPEVNPFAWSSGQPAIIHSTEASEGSDSYMISSASVPHDSLLEMIMSPGKIKQHVGVHNPPVPTYSNGIAFYPPVRRSVAAPFEGQPMYHPAMIVGNPERRQLRQRAFSQPNVGVFAQKGPHHKTKPCKYFAAAGDCPAGIKCNFIHARAPTQSSHASSVFDSVIGSHRESAEDQSSSSGLVLSEKGEAPELKEGERGKNFYRVKWRIVGGGVKIGSETLNNTHQSPGYQVLDQGPEVNDMAVDLDPRDMICAFHPHCPHGERCSFKHEEVTEFPEIVKPTMKSPDALGVWKHIVEDDDSQTLVTTPSSAGLPFKDKLEEDALDWGVGMITEPAKALTIDVRVAKSTPSSPLGQHFMLPQKAQLFSAETP